MPIVDSLVAVRWKVGGVGWSRPMSSQDLGCRAPSIPCEQSDRGVDRQLGSTTLSFQKDRPWAWSARPVQNRVNAGAAADRVHPATARQNVVAETADQALGRSRAGRGHRRRRSSKRPAEQRIGLTCIGATIVAATPAPASGNAHCRSECRQSFRSQASAHAKWQEPAARLHYLPRLVFREQTGGSTMPAARDADLVNDAAAK